jgi:hypothetical protein
MTERITVGTTVVQYHRENREEDRVNTVSFGEGDCQQSSTQMWELRVYIVPIYSYVCVKT